MGVNCSGKDILSAGIDDFIGRVVQIRADGLDLVTVCKYIGNIATGGVYYRTSFK
jgi:hypothetical protein